MATWLEAAWQEAQRIIETEIVAILAVAEALNEQKTLDDGTIRGIMRDLGIDSSRLDALRPPAEPVASDVEALELRQTLERKDRLGE